jgi:hypothetical protein
VGLGNKKGHISGKHVSGTHTSVIDGADAILKKMHGKFWFVSARPREIVVDRGGRASITVKRHINTMYANTLTVTFRKSGTVQKVDVVVLNLEKNMVVVIHDMQKIAEKIMRGAEFYDRT